jgi:hypothetical protein
MHMILEKSGDQVKIFAPYVKATSEINFSTVHSDETSLMFSVTVESQ